MMPMSRSTLTRIQSTVSSSEEPSCFFSRPSTNSDSSQHPTNQTSTSSKEDKQQQSSLFQSSQVTMPNTLNAATALSKLLRHWTPPPTSSEKAMAFLFVSAPWSSQLSTLVRLATTQLGPSTQLITVVGGGIVGPHHESQHECSMSFMGGMLPDGATLDIVSHSNQDYETVSAALPSYSSSSTIPTTTPVNNKGKNQHNNNSDDDEDHHFSQLVFADPHFTFVHEFLEHAEGMVAGGVSVAKANEPSLAIGNKVLPCGSLLEARLSGNVGLQVVLSQGCQAIGKTFTVTSVDGAAIYELDGVRAWDQLSKTLEQMDAATQTLAHESGVLGGVQREGDRSVLTRKSSDSKEESFSIREVTGFRPKSGSILVCGPQIKEGDQLRFHVRSKETAVQDWEFMKSRAMTERQVLGPHTIGKRLAALQVSCLARGPTFFQDSDVDLDQTRELLLENNEEASPPVAGFLANAEIGPVGIQMGSEKHPKSFLHGFAAVVIMLCHYTQDSVDEERHSQNLLETAIMYNATAADVWG